MSWFPARRGTSQNHGPADAFAFAQARCRPFVPVGVHKVGETGKTLAGRGEEDKSVLGEVQKSARARPPLVFGPHNDTGAHGIKVHGAVRGDDMVHVHCHGARIVPARNGRSTRTRVDEAGVSILRLSEQARQELGVRVKKPTVRVLPYI